MAARLSRRGNPSLFRLPRHSDKESPLRGSDLSSHRCSMGSNPLSSRPSNRQDSNKHAAIRSAAGEWIETTMSTKDPRKIYMQPPYSEKEQPPPGSDEEMSPQADHGESSYKGTVRLKGSHALITG